MANLGPVVFMCDTHAKGGISIQQARTVNRYSKEIPANPYAEKGVLNEIIRDKVELDNTVVQDHVPGHVFEVVRMLVAL